eukprot:8568513-Pyramimonas_sp.AAC.1
MAILTNALKGERLQANKQYISAFSATAQQNINNRPRCCQLESRRRGEPTPRQEELRNALLAWQRA